MPPFLSCSLICLLLWKGALSQMRAVCLFGYSYKKSPRSQTKNFFLHRISSVKPFFTVSKKLDAYMAYAESDKWDKETDKLPAVFFVCDSDTLEKRLQKQANRIHGKQPSDLRFYTTTHGRLMESDGLVDNIWLPLSDHTIHRQSPTDLS